MKIVISGANGIFGVPDGWHTGYVTSYAVAPVFNKFKGTTEESVVFAFGVVHSGKKDILIVRKKLSMHEKSGFVQVLRALGFVENEIELDEMIGRPAKLFVQGGKVKQIVPAPDEKPVEVKSSLGSEAIARYLAWSKKQEEQAQQQGQNNDTLKEIFGEEPAQTKNQTNDVLKNILGGQS